MKKILLIHTGGTIAMAENEQEGGIQLSEKHPLVSFQANLKSLALITTDQFSNLPSPHIGPETVLKLSNHIQKRMSQEKFDGIVITHGTDTLEETAYMLELLSPCKQPIVLTGAMKSSDELGADGPNNVLSAVRVATSNKAKHLGVVVVINDEIHAAKYVTKVHTSSVASFASPLVGPIGIVTKQKVILFHNQKSEAHLPVQQIDKRVYLLKLYSGIDNVVMEAIEAMKLDGLVIEAFGQGNVPLVVVPTIKRLIANNIPVVIVSRSLDGVVQPSYSYDGGGKHLQDLGVIFSKGLTGQKARLKLLFALHKTNNMNELQFIFD
ncbi:asparaginase [Pueribacillus sp. YX66]|uniref:asparaginase n=1 Tax=Pueribacillus sp. YX66 TaxID=3229242 RepID=UPI00358CFC8D